MALTRTDVRDGVAIAVGTFLLFGIITALVPNPIYIRQVPRTALDYLFLVLTSGFAGIYTIQRRRTDQAEETYAAVGSTVVGFLAFGCPICNAFLLALFSSSALMTYFDPLRPALGLLSAVSFVALVVYRHRRNCTTCA